MTFFDVMVNFGLAFMLLLINGWIGGWKKQKPSLFSYSTFGFNDIDAKRFSGNFFQLIVHPAIYLALVSAAFQFCSCQEMIGKLWMVIPFFWVIRFVFMLINDTVAFVNWRIQIKLFVASLVIGEGAFLCIIRPLVEKNKPVFIGAEQFLEAFWFAVLVYIAKTVWEVSKKELVGKEVFPSTRKSYVVIRRYNNLHRRYGRVIESIVNNGYTFKSKNHQKHFVCMLYAIMIYEMHNRTGLIRVVERIVKLLCRHREMTLGVMQVKTTKVISNNESIRIAIDKLYTAYSHAKERTALREAIIDYNFDALYFEEVWAIYYELIKYFDLSRIERITVKVKSKSAQK